MRTLTASLALLLLAPLAGCATMGGGDPTADLSNPEVTRRSTSRGDAPGISTKTSINATTI